MCVFVFVRVCCVLCVFTVPTRTIAPPGAFLKILTIAGPL